MISQEIVTLDSIIAALPDSELKAKNTRQRNQADLRLFNLEDRQSDYGAIALIDREVAFCSNKKVSGLWFVVKVVVS